MLHVNNGDGFTIAVSENRQLARIARSTVLSDNAGSVLVPMLDQVLGLRASRRSARSSSPPGSRSDEWQRARTDRVQIREFAPARGRPEVAMTDALGWVATAVFVSSYFFKRPALLRAAQMARRLVVDRVRRR